MIIRNDEERERAGIISLSYLCGACERELSLQYPVILVGDRHRTGYHLACAAQLAAEISDAVADYLSELSAAQPFSEIHPMVTVTQWRSSSRDPKYCSDTYRDEAHAEQTRERVRRNRERKAKQGQKPSSCT